MFSVSCTNASFMIGGEKYNYHTTIHFVLKYLINVKIQVGNQYYKIKLTTESYWTQYNNKLNGLMLKLLRISS